MHYHRARQDLRTCSDHVLDHKRSTSLDQGVSSGCDEVLRGRLSATQGDLSTALARRRADVSQRAETPIDRPQALALQSVAHLEPRDGAVGARSAAETGPVLGHIVAVLTEWHTPHGCNAGAAAAAPAEEVDDYRRQPRLQPGEQADMLAHPPEAPTPQLCLCRELGLARQRLPVPAAGVSSGPVQNWQWTTRAPVGRDAANASEPMADETRVAEPLHRGGSARST